MRIRETTGWLGLAALAIVGCGPNLNAPGYPLYPVTGEPLPRDRVARLFGSIASVDGKDVSRFGGTFELLPGCHVILTQAGTVDSTTYVAVNGSHATPPRGFVFAMKPGWSYLLKAWTNSHGEGAILELRTTMVIEAIDAKGASAGSIDPVHDTGALAACKKEWDSQNPPETQTQ